ncbi:hypothetical protein D1818_13945 [Aquimarina sp. BL5]|uniref:hypothetical protein n=1 Tax=Aquimarina sp. BL5 TaxID=1714860 RepID=UPI000E46E09A|nr:hypothetical protein [Aquimarina sp. BL5]AXT51894.1 hypothetical protein D1818_13945 [Aquimarina sp. BL5]RKN01062.1 hypothetical protein D7036_18105 [Aquimarina sp. BL5]
MNKLMYIGLIIILFSCKSNSIAQEKEKSNTQKPKVEKPKFGDQNDNQITKTSVISNNQISPNTIRLKGIVLEIFENKSICGTLYEVTVRIKVKKIIGSGSGIVNVISSKQEVIFGLTKNQLRNLETLQKKTDVNKEINLVVLEVLCRNSSKTAYKIISFTPKK